MPLSCQLSNRCTNSSVRNGLYYSYLQVFTATIQASIDKFTGDVTDTKQGVRRCIGSG